MPQLSAYLASCGFDDRLPAASHRILSLPSLRGVHPVVPATAGYREEPKAGGDRGTAIVLPIASFSVRGMMRTLNEAIGHPLAGHNDFGYSYLTKNNWQRQQVSLSTLTCASGWKA